jgi:hypothetical protein
MRDQNAHWVARMQPQWAPGKFRVLRSCEIADSFPKQGQFFLLCTTLKVQGLKAEVRQRHTFARQRAQLSRYYGGYAGHGSGRAPMNYEDSGRHILKATRNGCAS